MYQEETDKIAEAQRIITKWLSGEGEEICFDQEPFRKYSIGIITPLTTNEMSLGEARQKWILKRRPDSIGFEARTISHKNGLSFNLSFDFYIYYRCFPSYEEQIVDRKIIENDKTLINDKTNVHFRQKYKRIKMHIDSIPLNVNLPEDKSVQEIDCKLITTTINNELSRIAQTIPKHEDSWITTDKEPTIKLSSLVSSETYSAALPNVEKETPSWTVKASAKIWPAEDNQWRINILLRNVTVNDKANYQVSLFNVQIKALLLNGNYVSVPFEAAMQDYRYSTESWGKGINCVLSVSEDSKTAFTQTIPVYAQPKTTTRTNMQNACNFERLSTKKYHDALSEVSVWLNEYLKIWQKENNEFLKDSSYKSRIQGVRDFEDEVNRFTQGTEALKKDERLSHAFRLMNSTFAKGKNKGWFLFQLVFIVSQMPSLLAREQKDEKYIEELKKVDVLWFPTGGGKTEAYFGVIITALFYDRFRGKSRGVTAWLRYPLRMLSIQQLQRLVDVMVKAEEVRLQSKENSLINSDPFTVGYYVGEANTPNNLTIASIIKTRYHTKDPIVEWKEKVDTTKNVNDIRILVLQRCPHCQSSNITLNIDIENVRIKHVCKDCHKDAPIYISDSEIYRYAPSVIVGTVDRLARAGQTSLFAHLYGKFTQKCPQHGYVSFGTCIEDAVCKIKKSNFEELQEAYDPTPALLLQDELHLLKESLGTYDSHYETFLDLLSRNTGNGLPPKRLAATATIEGYKDHVWELYGREAIRFPVKGKREYDSAYVQPSETAKFSRIYVGIMPTGSSSEETVTIIQKAIKNHSKETAKEGKWSNEIVVNYDLSLVYVNEKNTAGNFGSSNEGDTEVLTGDKGLGEVRAVIGRVESDEKKGYEERLKGIVATSVISHGVDLSRLNFMTFCGMPNHASDYIQASSRVGRSHLGIVFTVFRPANNRERNIYQRFREYHERLYQLVQPVPINRFSESSISRTLSGILSSCILNILSFNINKKLDRADDFLLAAKGGLFNDDELNTLVKKSYKIDDMFLTGSSIDFFSKLISKLIGAQKRAIESGEKYSTFQRMKPPPVSSLREVREQIEFSVNRLKSHNIYVKVSQGTD
ncbi:MAG: helicase-related protein [Candidatus Daviesbacteria bacterium]|nr:helicase-related protein [Candidatus Daviesbacteria bacterium]